MYRDHETPRFWITYQEALKNYLLKRLHDKLLVDDIMYDVHLKVFVFCRRYDSVVKKLVLRIFGHGFFRFVTIPCSTR